jgi:UDP-N-acetylglucosamine--N-acetylmuramyl-(pentapeptide) pyrophosphoryl-undecaprenol N-acetylglucosamine transferase
MLATKMTTTTEAALEFLPREKTVVTGYPVRASFFSTDRIEARQRLNVSAGERLVLVAGATQGATAINDAVIAALPALLANAHVVHVTGAAGLAGAELVSEALALEQRARYHVAAYRDDLPELMVAADVGVFRAGASVLGEIPAAGLPSVLVPATYAGGHQRNNAQWLADGGAAVVVEEPELSSLGMLLPELLWDASRLEAMRSAAKALARPDAADAIAAVVLEVAR